MAFRIGKPCWMSHMAIEYHNRIVDGRRLSWDVSRLRDASSDLGVIEISLSEIDEFDTVYWFDDEHPPTCRSVVDHARRIAAADTSDPILLSPDGLVVDGMHRAAKALLDGATTIRAKRLPEYPEPDQIEEPGC